MNPIPDFGNGRQATKAFVSGHPEIEDLPVIPTDAGHVSCWELTAEELAEVQRTGRIYLHVAGSNHPAVGVYASLDHPADSASRDGDTNA